MNSASYDSTFIVVRPKIRCRIGRRTVKTSNGQTSNGGEADTIGSVPTSPASPDSPDPVRSDQAHWSTLHSATLSQDFTNPTERYDDLNSTRAEQDSLAEITEWAARDEGVPEEELLKGQKRALDIAATTKSLRDMDGASSFQESGISDDEVECFWVEQICGEPYWLAIQKQHDRFKEIGPPSTPSVMPTSTSSRRTNLLTSVELDAARSSEIVVSNDTHGSDASRGFDYSLNSMHTPWPPHEDDWVSKVTGPTLDSDGRPVPSEGRCFWEKFADGKIRSVKEV